MGRGCQCQRAYCRRSDWHQPIQSGGELVFHVEPDPAATEQGRMLLKSGTGARAVLLLGLLAGCSSGSSGAAHPLSPKASHNLLGNATFDDGKSLPWTTSFTAPAAGQAAVKDGEYCVQITDKGAANWDAQFRHREMTIRKGHRYFVRFRARSSQPTSIRPKVGMAGPPYREYFWQEIDLGTAPRVFEYEFTMQQDDDPGAELAFHLGGDLAHSVKPPYTVCVDDVELDDPEFVA